MIWSNRLMTLGLLMMVLNGCNHPSKTGIETDLLDLPFETITSKAQNTTVHMMMWQGDPLINQYMSDWVVPEVKSRFNIDLQIAPGQGTEIVKVLLSEIEAGKKNSNLDLCWINGETFFQLRQIQALFGPFTARLPNAQYIDFQNPFIGIDFQQPVDGYECPWGNVQLALICDSLRTPNPPLTMDELEKWWRKNPGKFTIPYEFTGMTLLKSWMIALAGGGNALDGPFDQKKYAMLSAKLWEFINRNKRYFWRKGETFPESVAAMHTMFVNQELDLTMSNNDSEVDNKIQQNIFPTTAKSFVLKSGTIQNSHFLGIPAQAANKAGAMTVINFLISPEAQLRKLNPKVWGDGSVLAMDKLPAEFQAQFLEVSKRKNSTMRATIQPFALKEPAPEYMVRLYEDFRKKVIEQ
ncbi:ABC transporter substrate-binding protein [Haliscomenobacter sp.]|uniref:ABC transporter substrate-binding protein n=1 Tax=Haliscomenobacter sp. TaxID=2717303 RepID=UPI003593772C